MIRYGSVCSGVEAASLAWQPLGWECAFVSEVEPFPCAVLHHRFGASRPIHPLDPAEIAISDDEWKIIGECKKENPETWRKIIESDLLGRYDEYKQRESWIRENKKLPEAGTIPNEGDFTKIGDKYRGKIDLLVGGTPCQSFSVAGKRAGLAGVSGLALDFIRLAYESQVKWIVWENVPGCFSTNGGRDFGAFLSGLSGIEIVPPGDGWRTAGFVRNTRRDRFGLAWRVLDAQFTRVPGFPFAVPQRRRRVFVVGCFGDWERAAAVLLEPNRLSWDSPPCRKTRQELAGDAGKGIESASGFRGSQFGELVGDGTAGTLKASNAGTAAGASTTIVTESGIPLNAIGVDGYNGEITGDIAATVDRNCRNQNGPTLCIGTGQSNAEKLEDCGVNLTCNHEAPIVAGFMGGQGAKAGGIAYSEGVSPTVKAGQSGTNTIPDVVCMNPADSQTSRIYDPKAAYPSLNANSGGGMSREGIVCVHGTQDPISNSEVANAVNRNHGAENCVCQYGNVAGTLEARHDSSPCADRGMNVICYENHMQDSRVKPCGECSPQLNAKAGTGGGNLPLVQSIAIAENIIGRKIENGGNGIGAQEELAYTQNATGVMGVSVNATVRRLLPVECERLMGFPDNHTRIPWGGKPEKDCPDSPRYKACGNSMCRNVMEWIGRGVDEEEGKTR